MRLPAGRTILAGVAAATGLWLGALGCNDSNNMTGPAAQPAATNVAGEWSGTYQSDNASLCAASPATATFSQDGARVTGVFRAKGCGIAGAFTGNVTGDMLVGAVNMAGCTGGAVTGTIRASEITIQVGDFRRDLATGGPTDVMPGGWVTLTR